MSSRPPKRLLRNYLLDRRFQLKYTSMVVLVTVMVAGVLGYFAYDFSRKQTQQYAMSLAMYPNLHPEVAENMEGWARAKDQEVLLAILGAIGILALTLGFTGIVVTHKVVGPAYKLKQLIRDVTLGHLRIAGRLRRSDELQDVFEAFAAMVNALRERQAEEVAQLDHALERAKQAGIPSAALDEIREVIEKMRAELL